MTAHLHPIVSTEQPDAPHDVLLFAKWGPTREASVEHIRDWLKKQFPQAAKAKASMGNGSGKKRD